MKSFLPFGQSIYPEILIACLKASFWTAFYAVKCSRVMLLLDEKEV
jgi:hypothetical protein